MSAYGNRKREEATGDAGGELAADNDVPLGGGKSSAPPG
jgi:hypothetical protein